MFICVVKLFLSYLRYRWNTLFIVRKENEFVCKIRDSFRNSNSRFDFESELKMFRTQAKASKKALEVKDFGAGSKKLGRVRTIQSIYASSVSPLKWQRFLHNVVKDFSANHILEMGTSLGFTTVYLSKAITGKVITIEACPSIFKESQTMFEQMHLYTVQSVNSTFQNYFITIDPSQKFDFIFIDGHHDGDALLNYVHLLKPHLLPNALIIVDDIRWSEGMHKAWTKLTADAQFSNNWDGFKMGLLQFNNH